MVHHIKEKRKAKLKDTKNMNVVSLTNPQAKSTNLICQTRVNGAHAIWMQNMNVRNRTETKQRQMNWNIGKMNKIENLRIVTSDTAQ